MIDSILFLGSFQGFLVGFTWYIDDNSVVPPSHPLGDNSTVFLFVDKMIDVMHVMKKNA